jgi:phospho-N-acetylmuramoyl-pentapeptide-transferase
MLVIVSTANAVNITDGLDGLAGGLLILAFGGFSAIAYMKGLMALTAFLFVIIGSLTAFLWYNIAPAKFFMGDTGALSLGATLGVIAMMTNSVIVLPLIGFVFVIETLSCILQLLSKKFVKKKIFLITPLHHHFEAIGWTEGNVVMRFWIIGGIFTVMGIIIGLIGRGIG